MVRILYIDDVKNDLSKFAAELATSEIRVVTKSPTDNPLEIQSSLRSKPDLCLLDYDLAKAQIEYKGTMLARVLREGLPGVPLVLFTRKSLVNAPQLDEFADVFDESIYKSDLESRRKQTRSKIVSLAKGFRKLRRTKSKDWSSLLGLLKADEHDADLLLRAAPPISQGADGAEWTVSHAATWIRKTVLHYPGILYDDLHASAALGVSLKSFHKRGVQSLLKPARYKGLFSDQERRWWRGRLFFIAKQLGAEADLHGPVALTFAQAYQRVKRIKLSPSVCNTSRKSPADCLCFVLRTPVMREFSLPYYPDKRPSVMDEARVSFRAIRESNIVKEELFDQQHRAIVEELQAAVE